MLKVLERLDISVIAYSDISEERGEACLRLSEDGYSALIGYETYSRWYIYYNDRKSVERIRFTLMHELGHISIDHQNENEVSEAEANFFAKYILAPPIVIDQLIDDIEDYVDLSNIFQISHEMSYYQMHYYNKWVEFGKNQNDKIDSRILQLVTVKK